MEYVEMGGAVEVNCVLSHFLLLQCCSRSRNGSRRDLRAADYPSHRLHET